MISKQPAVNPGNAVLKLSGCYIGYVIEFDFKHFYQTVSILKQAYRVYIATSNTPLAHIISI
jgi:hypothetical protein